MMVIVKKPGWDLAIPQLSLNFCDRVHPVSLKRGSQTVG
jgi:hypothetical protein